MLTTTMPFIEYKNFDQNFQLSEKAILGPNQWKQKWNLGEVKKLVQQLHKYGIKVYLLLWGVRNWVGESPFFAEAP